MDAILDFNQPFQPQLLDNLYQIYQSGGPQSTDAQSYILRFKEHPQSWTVTDTIIDQCTNINSRFLGILIMEDLVKTKWKGIPEDEREGLKNYILTKISRILNNDTLTSDDSLLLDRLNLVLVQILKNDWPHKWPSFIPDIIAFSKTKESICDNNMKILKLLSEEVFMYDVDDLQTGRIQGLKSAFKEQFQSVFEFCLVIVEQSTKEGLIKSSLRTLQSFVNWIPIDAIYGTKFLSILLNYFKFDPFRNDCLECFIEVVSIKVPDQYNQEFFFFSTSFMQNIVNILPPTLPLDKMYNTLSEDDLFFIRQLSLFFYNFFRDRMKLIENEHSLGACLQSSLTYMLNILTIDEPELFKIAIDFWKMVSEYAYFNINSNDSYIYVDNIQFLKPEFYDGVFKKVREVIINRMVRPEEVLIEEDHNGQLQHVKATDTNTISLYKIMKDCLVYLTHLNKENTRQIIDRKMSSLLSASSLSWSELNSISWSLGSITGTFPEEDEKSFIIKIIKSLLSLVEMAQTRDDKAVIASGIMYVVGQYPRFLKFNWKFFKTVIYKLIDFMKESYPGVKDMAIDTFRNIAIKCKREFVVPHSPDDNSLFLYELLTKISPTIESLEPHQIYSYIGSLGILVNMIMDPKQKNDFIQLALTSWNLKKVEIMNNTIENQVIFSSVDILRALHDIYRVHASFVEFIGQDYRDQFANMCEECINIYTLFGRFLFNQLQQHGISGLSHIIPKLLVGIRKDIIVFFKNYFKTLPVSEFPMYIPSLSVFSQDYGEYPQEMRENIVIDFYIALLKRGEAGADCLVESICQYIVVPSIQLLPNRTQDNEFLDLFYRLIHICVEQHFKRLTLFFNVVPDSILFGIKLIDRQISELCLQVVEAFINKVMTVPAIVDEFWSKYYFTFFQTILDVLTDRCHRNGFYYQCRVIKLLITIIVSGRIKVLLFPSNELSIYENNINYSMAKLISSLSVSFPNAGNNNILELTKILFEKHDIEDDKFYTIVRDFLLQLSECDASANKEFFLYDRMILQKQKDQEEHQLRAAVPGLIKENFDPLDDL